ncbi:PREDICTED: apolipoprotein L2 [Rhinopithecus bieti]|uniref:Apolipoprotein L2 n=1 Tax=Rhinopithecus bieti TaxID=61621 RepID=A0A2K6KNW9_RHIBE|nr:PREDICTED: apolipoprotein L2 [Rhinopithecus bieti]XP_017712267.1 PREDICTED: apolipoprotein L2 [Rhinopithecus bieti]XP_017712268.1 PREDICTED: apolipoprotein L2 [Rhinopithecus bieti]
MNPESSIFIEDSLKYFQDRVSRENLLQLLTDGRAWSEFMVAAELSRDEADALRKALNKLVSHMVMKDKNRHDKDQLHREWFLKEFPRLKKELEDHIRMLRSLADQVQRVHRGTTITNVVANSFSTTAGALSLLGLGLAPFTEGLSLLLMDTAAGLGAASAVTGITSSVVELVKQLQARNQARSLDQSSTDAVKVVKEFVGGNTPNFLTLVNSYSTFTQRIGRDIRAIRQARVNPQLGAYAPPPQVIGRISLEGGEQVERVAEGGEQVERVAEGPALAMSRGAMTVGAATGAILLLLDVVNTAYETKHLLNGAKSELAEELKKQAQDLEGKLNVLIKIHEMLQ